MLNRLPRTAPDACPGVLRPHHAADGELVRVRVPGGRLGATALRALSTIAVAEGDSRIGLTSRANLQLRGLSEERLPQVADGLRAAGLLPDAGRDQHERVRNILASPLSGRLPGSRADIDPLVTRLDDGLCSRPRLAGLPGRFLFAVDDGCGDLASAGADVRLVASADGRFGLDVAGAGGPVLTRDDAVDVALQVAEAFLDELDQLVGSEASSGPAAWRIAELGPGSGQDSGAARVLARLGRLGEHFVHDRGGVDRGGGVLGPGLVEQLDGRFAVCAVAPLGLIDAEQAEALAAVAELCCGEESVRLTAWRRVVVADLDLPAALAARELLAATGLVVDAGTGWDRLTACAGRPGCAKSLTDVHADARALVGRLAPIGPSLHLAGCDRGCGRPAGAALAFATPTGYVGRATGQEENLPLSGEFLAVLGPFSSPAVDR